MSSSVDYDFRGLVTAPGLLARAEASASAAFNIVFDEPGVARKRRGFSRSSTSLGGFALACHASEVLGATMLAHYGTATVASVLRTISASGTAAVPAIDGASMTRTVPRLAKFATGGRSTYFTTDEGVRRVESGLTDVRYAGMPRGSLNLSSITASGTGALLANFSRAYRATWHRKDFDGVELAGAPTSRCRVTTTVQGNPVLAVHLPQEFGTSATPITTSYYLRLWTTRSFPISVGQPDDEMYLTQERVVTAGNIVAGFALVTDNTPDAFLLASPPLNTNAVNFPFGEAGIAQGIVNADEPPPLANDVAYWADCMWFADISYRDRLSVTLISVNGSGLVAGDTVTIDGVVYTATAGAPIGFSQFQVFTTGNVLDDIEFTARGLAERINLNTLNTTCYAYYTSVGQQFPGSLYIERRRPGGLLFQSSRPLAWRPDGANINGTVDAQPNGLAFSKPLRSDAVPPVNLFAAGPREATILRIFPYRAGLLVFTTVGIYRVTGTTARDFSLDELDLTYKLLAPSSVCALEDKVYAWCWEGLVEIDDRGVSLISQPITPTVQATFANVQSFGFNQAIVFNQAFSVPAKNDHRVMFFFPSPRSGSDYGCTQWLTFDVRERTWSQGRFGPNDYRGCGVARASDKVPVVFSLESDSRFFEERQTYSSSADYSDTTTANVTSPVSAVLLLQYKVPAPGGSVHWQRSTLTFVDEAGVNPAPTAITVSFATEHTSSGYAVAPAGPVTRLEVPQICRRGNRLRLQISHTTAEAFGLAGVETKFEVGSDVARRT